MALENAQYIPELVEANPPGTDFVLEGDNHVRMLKDVLKRQFPDLASAAVINAGENPNEPDETLTAPDNLMLWSPKAIADFVKKYFPGWNLVTTDAPVFSVYKDSAQLLAAGGTLVEWEQAKFDDGSIFDFTNNRVIPQTAGRWQMSAQVTIIENLSDGSTATLELRKNGNIEYQKNTEIADSQIGAPDVSGIIEVNGTTDYVEVYWKWGKANSYAAQLEQYRTFFEGHFVGQTPAP